VSFGNQATQTTSTPRRAPKSLFTTPIASYKHWGLIAVIALAFIFIPQLKPNDWERNTAGLLNGLDIYADPGYVYPPWGPVLMWPYRLMSAPGSRVASVLVMGWLAQRRGWSLARFGAMIAGPFFLWTMVMSNVDVLALLLPVALWESAEDKRWQAVGRSIAIAVLLVKPQGGILIILYWLWVHREDWRELLVSLGIAVLIVVPISLVGKPPLFLQWLDNIQNPSQVNQNFWAINNVSLSDHLGPIPAVVIVSAALVGLAAFMRYRGKNWTRDHTYATLFLVPMLLGPYASNQSMIVPLALVPSWPAVIIQYVVAFTASYFEIYRVYSAWWALLFGLSALWLFVPQDQKKISDAVESQNGLQTAPTRRESKDTNE
jgi:hypothetical protein